MHTNNANKLVSLALIHGLVSMYMKLVGLPVFTEQGDRVGTVIDLEYDENNQIKIYHIRRSGIFGFFRKKILIYPHMVISIDDKKMIVKGPEIKIKEPAIAVGTT